jgi:S1-C subfamily serine protease
MQGLLPNGRMLTFDSIGQDSVTRLVLLQAENWRPEFGDPVRVPEGDEFGHGMVFAVLPSGPIRAALTKLNKLGFLRSEKRVIPLNEVQFEAPIDGCAGALLVDEDGELLGVLGATLSRGGFPEQQGALGTRFATGPTPFNNTPSQGPAYSPGPAERILRGQQRMGPSDLMVAYTAGVVVLKKVVEGFRSPDHQVRYPSLGLLCKDTPGGGALVQAVQPDSPAEHAGIQTGDILLTIAGEPIRNQVDFALVVLNQTAGDKILIHFKRRNHEMVDEVIVGSN